MSRHWACLFEVELELLLEHDLIGALNQLGSFVIAPIPTVRWTLAAGEQHDLRLVSVKRISLVLGDDFSGRRSQLHRLFIPGLQADGTHEGNDGPSVVR